MTDLTHDVLVFFSKTYGLFYLIALSLVVVAYTLWPGNRQKFDHAAKSIFKGEDGPWH